MYKRQGLRSAGYSYAANEAEEIERVAAHGVWPVSNQDVVFIARNVEGTPDAVSYTHLDVYKRQVCAGFHRAGGAGLQLLAGRELQRRLSCISTLPFVFSGCGAVPGDFSPA